MNRLGIFVFVASLLLFSQVLSAQNVSFGLPIFSVSGTSATAAAAGDFNGDGNLDLAVTVCDDCNQGGNVAILLGNGDGTFQAPALYPVRYFPSHIAVGDFNHDGKLDLAVVNSGYVVTSRPASISILLGNGDGTFQPQVEYPLAWHADAVSLGDFNEDGNVDLAVANYNLDSHGSTNTISLLFGNGDGTFEPAQLLSLNDAYGPVQIAAGDFTGSGHLDMAIAAYGDSPFFYTGGRLAFLKGNGDGTFQDPQSYDSPVQLGSIVAGDFNRDGKLDVVAAGKDQPGTSGIYMTWVALGNGDGSFQPLATIVPDSKCFKCVVSADFNSDQNPDAAVAVANGFDVALGNGDGTFQQPVQFDAGAGVLAIATGDFNNDGKPDVVLVTFTTDSNVAVFLNTTQ